MTSRSIPLKQKRSFGETLRREVWWFHPLLVFLGFSAFIVYSTWSAFQGDHYRFGPYLSPFYSPELLGGEHAFFGPKTSWFPGWVPFSPAFLILWAPGGFRLTCYYYRGAYYKAFWSDPPSCAVGEPRSGYRGEQSFPLILQNIHRYFLYFALIFLVFLSHDVWEALWFTNTSGETTFGIGVHVHQRHGLVGIWIDGAPRYEADTRRGVPVDETKVVFPRSLLPAPTDWRFLARV